MNKHSDQLFCMPRLILRERKLEEQRALQVFKRKMNYVCDFFCSPFPAQLIPIYSFFVMFSYVLSRSIVSQQPLPNAFCFRLLILLYFVVCFLLLHSNTLDISFVFYSLHHSCVMALFCLFPLSSFSLLTERALGGEMSESQTAYCWFVIMKKMNCTR